jgi:hypothetical protein
MVDEDMRVGPFLLERLAGTDCCWSGGAFAVTGTEFNLRKTIDYEMHKIRNNILCFK